MTETPGSPRAARLSSPSWLDGRLVLGVLLVLVSVLVGAKVLAGADSSQRVWLATRDLAAGTLLAPGDLHPGRVRLFDASPRYVAGAEPVGYIVARAVSRDELLPVGALQRRGNGPGRREVTVPVATGHLPPDLSHGEQVDVYVTPEDRGKSASATATPRLVLPAVTVSRVVRGGGLAAGGQDQPVVLSTDPADVLTLVQAMSEGRIDLVRVPATRQGPLTTVSQAR